jgi:hypothetical protein
VTIRSTGLKTASQTRNPTRTPQDASIEFSSMIEAKFREVLNICSGGRMISVKPERSGQERPAGSRISVPRAQFWGTYL